MQQSKPKLKFFAKNHKCFFRNYAKEKEGRKNLTKSQCQSVYDNVDGVTATPSAIPRTLESPTERQVDAYTVRPGKVLYGQKLSDKRAGNQSYSDYSNVPGGSHFGPQIYETRSKPEPLTYYRPERRYGVEVKHKKDFVSSY